MEERVIPRGSMEREENAGNEEVLEREGLRI